MTAYLVTRLDDCESFVVFSVSPPAPSVPIDWYWQFNASEHPVESLLESKRVWIRCDEKDFKTLLSEYPSFLEREQVYVSKGLIKIFNRMKFERDVYVFSGRTFEQENTSHVRS